jgi:hypothetical protein
MGIIDAFDQLLQTVMSSMKMHINDYCELETTEGEYNLVTKDGSMATIIRYEGFRNLISAMNSTLSPVILLIASSRFLTSAAINYRLFTYVRLIRPVN